MDNEFAIIARALRQILWGMTFEAFSVMTLIGGSILLVMGNNGNTAYHALHILCGALYLSGKAATVIGMIRCLAVPSVVKWASILVMFAIAGQLLSTMLLSTDICQNLFGLRFIPLRYEWLVYLVGVVTYLAGLSCFLVFLNQLALYIQRSDLSASAVLVRRLILGLVMGTLVVLSFSMIVNVPEPTGCCWIILLCGTAILTVAKYAQLLSLLAAACLQHARREEQGHPDDVHDSGENDNDFA